MRPLLSVAGLIQLASLGTCALTKLENLVTFGDSFTDEGRLGYFINNDGKAPPAGAMLPESNKTASGGYAWGRYVAKKTGSEYFNYAVSGATCSNKIVERYFALIRQPFPSVLEYEIPAFKADTKLETPFKNRKADNTAYAVWIGTNDLGANAFLTDSNAPGSTLTSYVDCVWQVFDNIYETGGRNFVLLNVSPLELLPLYNVPEQGGTMDSQFWANKTAYNMTEYKHKIKQYSDAANTMFDYGVPFQVLIKKRWPGATVTVFNVHSLLVDIYNEPSKYLTAPASATGYYIHCDPRDNSKCQTSSEAMSSFLWYDELHPSERAEEIVADNFIEVVQGKSKYGTVYVAS